MEALALRRFEYIQISSSREQLLLPMYYHVDKPHLPWLNEQQNIILHETTRLIADHFEEVRPKLFAAEFSDTRTLLVGSDVVCCVYSVERHLSSARVMRYVGHSGGDQQLQHVPVMRRVAINVWLFPASEQSAIPVDMFG